MLCEALRWYPVWVTLGLTFIHTKSRRIFRNESSFSLHLRSAIQAEKRVMLSDICVSPSKMCLPPRESDWNEYPSFRHLSKEHVTLTIILGLNSGAYCSWEGGGSQLSVSLTGLPAARGSGPLGRSCSLAWCWPVLDFKSAFPTQRYLFLFS